VRPAVPVERQTEASTQVFAIVRSRPPWSSADPGRTLANGLWPPRCRRGLAAARCGSAHAAMPTVQGDHHALGASWEGSEACDIEALLMVAPAPARDSGRGDLLGMVALQRGAFCLDSRSAWRRAILSPSLERAAAAARWRRR